MGHHNHVRFGERAVQLGDKLALLGLVHFAHSYICGRLPTAPRGLHLPSITPFARPRFVRGSK